MLPYLTKHRGSSPRRNQQGGAAGGSSSWSMAGSVAKLVIPSQVGALFVLHVPHGRRYADE